MAITDDYQIEVTNSAGSSLLLGPNTPYIVETIGGLGDPPVRINDTARPRDHGSWVGSDYMDVRTISAAVVVTGSSAADTVVNLDALKAMWIPDTDPAARATLAFRLPGDVAKKARGRTRRLDADLSQVRNQHVRVQLEFVANDPQLLSVFRKYLAVPVSSTSTSGRTYNRIYNYTYGSETSDGSVQATNSGNVSARPTVQLFGPLTNPRFENVTTGEVFELALTISAAEMVIVDFDDRTVLLGGSTSRYYAVTSASAWWELPPGTSTVKLYDGAGSTTGRASLLWNDTWI